MSMRGLIDMVSNRQLLAESESVGSEATKSIWCISPFRLLPPKTRFCEADTAEEAARILAARMRPKCKVQSIVATGTAAKRIHDFHVTLTYNSGEHGGVQELDISVSDQTLFWKLKKEEDEAAGREFIGPFIR